MQESGGHLLRTGDSVFCHRGVSSVGSLGVLQLQVQHAHILPGTLLGTVPLLSCGFQTARLAGADSGGAAYHYMIDMELNLSLLYFLSIKWNNITQGCHRREPTVKSQGPVFLFFLAALDLHCGSRT